MFFDFTGALVSFLSTYFFIRLNPNAWLLGILATLINGGLYWYKGIYADMALELIYFLSMVYGWALWQPKKTKKNNPIMRLQHLPPFMWFMLGTTLCCVYISIHYLLSAYTDSTVATLDAITTSLSLVAQWLMCHKIIVTWILWFFADALYAWMYWGKHLPFHTVLMLVYTGMAIIGYFYWARQSQSSTSPAPEKINPPVPNQKPI